MDIDPKELRAAAIAAGGKQWDWWSSNSFLRLTERGGQDGAILSGYSHDGGGTVVCYEQVQRYIAAASPATMIALTDRLVAAEAQRDTHAEIAKHRGAHLEALIKVGASMANTLYNMAQRKGISDDERELFTSLRKAWDDSRVLASKDR